MTVFEQNVKAYLKEPSLAVRNTFFFFLEYGCKFWCYVSHFVLIGNSVEGT